MLHQRVKPAELARRINVRPQEVNRITTLRHRTKIDTISQALAVLGTRLDLSVV
jgi:antitoxin HicB